MILADATEQIVGRERRGACFASRLVRRYLNEFAPPRQLNRYPPPLFENGQKHKTFACRPAGALARDANRH
jgi:hypothetical protein